MTKGLYMMLADGLDMQLTGTAQCITPSLSGRNNLLNCGLVSPCFKRSSKTCKEIRTKISPLYQNHKPYKMVYCSRNCLLITLQSPKIVFQTYIIHPLVPNPYANLSPHWRWSAANPNQAPGNALLLAASECIYHIWYINLYITYIRYFFIQLSPLTHSLCSSLLSPQKVSFGESTSIHPLCSDRNLSTISAFQSFVSSGKPSDSIVSDPVDKGKDLYTFKRLVSCWKERTIQWSSSSNSTLSKPCVSNVARCTKLGT